jgi:hypothetical protein
MTKLRHDDRRDIWWVGRSPVGGGFMIAGVIAVAVLLALMLH